MPTYEYECLKCKRHFERLQSILAEPLKHCPVCKGKAKRLIGAGAGLIFKGSGFYITDHRSKNYQESASKHNDTKVDKDKQSKMPETPRKEKESKKDK